MSEYPPAGVPTIAPVPPGVERPFWSVMVPVYNRVTWLEQAIQSVVSQFPNGEAVQVEVVDDCSPENPDIEAIIGRVGDRRVSLRRNATRLGMVNNWNACIERARGRWVHLLHDDDYVLPGFYSAHRAAAEANPAIGFAVCGATVIEPGGANPFPTVPVPAGVAPDWTGWLVYMNWLLMPAVVVRREAYETVGGFHPGLKHAVDWEMWMRLASRFPLWLDHTYRACYRKHETSETARQVRTGENVADIARALDVARHYIPGGQADSIIRISREAWAMGVMNGARDMLRRGDVVAAMAQVREAMKLAVSPKVIREIEGGVMKYLDAYCVEVERAIERLRSRTADANLMAQLRDARRRVCRQWLELPAEELHLHYDSDLGRIHKLIMNSGLSSTPIDSADQELLNALPTLAATADHAGLVRSLYAPSASRI